MIEKTLAELTLNITDGKHGDCRGKDDSGFYFISCKDVRDGQIHYEDARQIIEEDFWDAHKRTRLEPDDILVTNSGTIGRMAFIRDVPLTYRTTFQKSVAIVKPDKSKILPKYLYYQLQNCVDGFVNQSNGAAQKNLLLSTMRAFKMNIHEDGDTQIRIASILSAYDDLIENNQKQIKLLEEAAQRLFKEWFVDLRFPGHETTPITDGIPEGWTEGTLVDLAVFKRGKTITKGQVNEGNVPVVAGGLEPAYYHDTPNTDAPVITVSGSGANAGFTRMYYTKVWASDCSYIDVSVTRDIAWIYCFLKENKASIDAMQKGAAQPHVYAKDLNAMKVVVPCDSLMEQFRTAAEPMFSKIGKLEMQIKMLTEARDRLLPKLMNGEIEV